MLRGNPGKRPLPLREPRPRTSVPTCPAHLGDEARREWRRMSKELAGMGLLTKVDRAALSLYCDSWGRWVEALEAMKRYGLMMKSPNGFPMQSPYLSVATKAGEQVRLLLSEFGLSPAARTRVHATSSAPEEESKWHGLL